MCPTEAFSVPPRHQYPQKSRSTLLLPLCQESNTLPRSFDRRRVDHIWRDIAEAHQAIRTIAENSAFDARLTEYHTEFAHTHTSFNSICTNPPNPFAPKLPLFLSPLCLSLPSSLLLYPNPQSFRNPSCDPSLPYMAHQLRAPFPCLFRKYPMNNARSLFQV